MSDRGTPAGWYPDPRDATQQRYWDGSAWTEATTPAGGASGPQQVGHGYAQASTVVPAGFWIRFAAALIDGLLVGVPLAVLGAIVDDPDRETSEVRFSVGWNPSMPPWLNVLSIVINAAYYGVLIGSTGQTVGKKLCGLRVVDATTGAGGIGLGRAIGRHFMSIVSAIPCALGYLWMLWDGRKQTWHDKVVDTQVVRA